MAAKGGPTWNKGRRGPRQNKDYRLLMLTALDFARHNGLTRAQIVHAIDIAPSNGRTGLLLREEQESGRIEAERHDGDGYGLPGRDVTVFFITAKGRADLESGNVKRLCKGGRR
jgi:hypothetical protein